MIRHGLKMPELAKRPLFICSPLCSILGLLSVCREGRAKAIIPVMVRVRLKQMRHYRYFYSHSCTST